MTVLRIEDPPGSGIWVPVAVGAQGPPGADGADGEQGPVGPQGVPGADGADGADGPQGPAGEEGPQGPAGADGEQGPQGIQGVPGTDGADGAEGPEGPEGPQGPQGEPGTPGTTLPDPTGQGGLFLGVETPGDVYALLPLPPTPPTVAFIDYTDPDEPRPPGTDLGLWFAVDTDDLPNNATGTDHTIFTTPDAISGLNGVTYVWQGTETEYAALAPPHPIEGCIYNVFPD